jgi:uncharacterized protein
MMSETLSMFDASIPVFIKGINTLMKLLDKAEEYAKSKNFDSTVLVSSRLAPDMLPLNRQIQIATDGVKGCVARLTRKEVPGFPDTEVTIDELKKRLEKTLAFVNTFTSYDINGTENIDIHLKFGPREFSFKGIDYLLQFVLPNFYFHMTIAYAILRHNGVSIGKVDFLGAT